MRVTPDRPSRRFAGDDGMVAAFIALSLVVLIGVGALAVDLGDVWQTRRHLITGTDAAALAAAQQYAKDEGDGCSDAAPEYLAANVDDANLDDCTHEELDGGGIVTVEASAVVETRLARILGITEVDQGSTTSVRYGAPSTVVGGLRPFGLCIDVLEALVPPPVPGNGVTYRIPYGKDDQPDACGGESVPGNWGIQDFDGGANRNSDTKEWTRNGYPGAVSIGDWIEGDTGAFSNSLNSELTYLRDHVDSFTLPIFEVATGNGANAEFLIADFAQVRLMGFMTTGPQANRYLEIQFVPDVVQGEPGGAEGHGAHVIWICSVDPGGGEC